jgi:hypothetical protein
MKKLKKVQVYVLLIAFLAILLNSCKDDETEISPSTISMKGVVMKQFLPFDYKGLKNATFPEVIPIGSVITGAEIICSLKSSINFDDYYGFESVKCDGIVMMYTIDTKVFPDDTILETSICYHIVKTQPIVNIRSNPDENEKGIVSIIYVLPSK